MKELKLRSKATRVFCLMLSVLMLVSCLVMDNIPASASSKLDTKNLRLQFYECDPPYLGLTESDPMKDHMMALTFLDFDWLTVDEKGGSADFDITMEFKAKDSSDSSAVPVGQTKVMGVYNSTIAWRLENPQAGTYTVTVTEKSTRDSGTISLELFELRFHQGEGDFENYDNNTYTAYASADNYFSRIPIPTLTPPADGREFIGWATQADQTDYTNVISKTPGSEADLYAAFGVKKTWKSEVQENGVKVDKLDFGSVGFGKSVEPRTLKLKNTGTQEIYDVCVRSSLTYFDLKFTLPNGDDKMQSGQEATLEITPKSNLPIGSYKDTLIVGPRTGMLFVDITISIGQKEVVVVPHDSQKEYGQVLKASEVPVDVQTPEGGPADVTFDELGITLESNGFTAAAEVGDYNYTIGSTKNPNYRVSMSDQAGKVKVVKATPSGIPTADGIYKGNTLSDDQLRGTFVNPHMTEWPVPGTLTWETHQTVTETKEYNWIFTPDPTVEKNYKTAHGSVYVIVSQKEPTKVIPENGDGTTFSAVYDSKEHGLSFTTDRPADIGGEVTVQYAPQGTDDWTATAPSKAGTYKVAATVKETSKYAAGLFEGELIIEPKQIELTYTAEDKTYDGKLDATVSVEISNKVDKDDVFVSASGSFATAYAENDKAVTIKLSGLNGQDANNYKLPDTDYHARADIKPKSITIKVKDGVTVDKFYGEQCNLTTNSFEAVGTAEGETIDDLFTQFSSDGTATEAVVATYKITAMIGNSNYTLENADVGNLTVKKTTPVLRTAVQAGLGHKGCELDHVTLTGEYYNPYNPNMIVNGTFSWVESGKKLPENVSETTEKWTFTMNPSFSDNYNNPDLSDNTVKITLLDKEPLHLSANSYSVAYNGKPQQFTNFEVAYPEPGGNAEITTTVIYKAEGQSEWTNTAPTDAGLYDVKITAQTEEEQYAGNTVTATMTITAVSPTIKEMPTLYAREGMLIDEIPLLPGFEEPVGIDGTELEGRFEWDAAGAAITEDGAEFQYTFIPSNTNYTNVTGSVTVKLADDLRVLQATVYNLPNAFGYHDYAIINIRGSDLRAGDKIEFYTNADCSNPESEPMIISPDDVERGTVKIQLDGDALVDNDGVIYARIASSKKHVANEILYLPELGFILPDSITVKNGTTDLTVKYTDDSYAELFEGISFLLEGTDYVEIADENGLTVTLKCVRTGSTRLTVAVSFKHPDPNSIEREEQKSIVITKMIDVHSAAHEHKGILVAEKDETCTEAGNKPYYECDCGKWFEDEACTKEITDHNSVIIPATHRAKKVESKEPTATETGNIAYWYCEICGKYFKDEALTQEITKEQTVLAATETTKPTSATTTIKKNDTVTKKSAKTTPKTVTKLAKVVKVKVKSRKKKLNISWKKVKGATGYEVLYATNNKFTKNKKKVSVKKNKVTLKKLKARKKYFVKVRAYKKVSGDKYYGKWSKVIKKKTK